MAWRRSVGKRIGSAWSVLEKPLYGWGICSTSGLCLPDFLGIGAQKAGTTWLHENLRCHPQLFLPEQKELHYFDAKFHHSLSSYSESFRSGVGKVKGEITPAYGILAPRRIRFIRKVVPQARLIFLMRNPIERAWSQAVMNLVTQPGKRFEEVRSEEFFEHFTAARSLERSDYGRILDNWLSVYPREQLWIGYFEDIARDPRGLLRSVFGHLGVSLDVDWSLFPYGDVIRPQARLEGEARRSGGMPPEYRQFLEQLYRPHLESLSVRFGESVAGWR